MREEKPDWEAIVRDNGGQNSGGDNGKHREVGRAERYLDIQDKTDFRVACLGSEVKERPG